MKWEPRFIKTIILLTFFYLISPLNAQETPKHEAKKYTLAVVPQFPPVEIYRRWTSYQNDYMPIEKLSYDKNIK